MNQQDSSGAPLAQLLIDDIEQIEVVKVLKVVFGVQMPVEEL